MTERSVDHEIVTAWAQGQFTWVTLLWYRHSIEQKSTM